MRIDNSIEDNNNGYVQTDMDMRSSVQAVTTWEAWIYPTDLGGQHGIFGIGDATADNFDYKLQVF